MNIILVLNRKGAQSVRVAVNLPTKALQQKVITLLDRQKTKEAFDLLLSKAEVTDYLPPGKKPAVKPAMILMEDLL